MIIQLQVLCAVRVFNIMAMLVFFIQALLIAIFLAFGVSVEEDAAKKNTNQQQEWRIPQKHVERQSTFKSIKISRELTDRECRSACQIDVENTCPVGCHCRLFREGTEEQGAEYYCEPYAFKICSPCTVGDVITCPRGCGCYPIDDYTLDEFYCRPHDKDFDDEPADESS